MALGDMKRWDQALPMLSEAVRDAEAVHGPTARILAFYFGHLARYLLQAGELKKGIEAYGRAAAILSADPIASQAYLSTIDNQALANLAARATSEAIALFEFGAKRRGELKLPQPVTSQASLAVTKALSGDFSTALAAVTKLENPKSPALRQILYAKGICLRMARNYSDALAHQQRALLIGVVLDRERAQFDFEIGMNQMELGNDEAAVVALEKARTWFAQNVPRLIPPHADALSALARIALKRNQVAPAMKFAQQADEYWISFDPSSRWAGLAALTYAETLKAGAQASQSQAAFARAASILAKSKFAGDAGLARQALVSSH